jgi:hypothetical protein
MSKKWMVLAILFVAGGSVSSSMAVPIPVISYLFDGDTTPQYGSVTGTLIGPNGSQTSGPTYNSLTPLAYTGNQSLKLDGTDDRMRFGQQTVGQSINGASAVTFTTWIRFENDSDLHEGQYANPFFTSRVSNASAAASNIAAYVRNDTGNEGKILIGGRDQAGASFQAGTHSTALTAGNWHFIVGIFDYANDQIRISIDNGTFETTAVTFASSTYINSTPPSSLYDVVGSGENGEHPLTGYIDEVAIFNSAISQDDVNFLYQNGLSAIPEPTTMLVLAAGGLGVLLRRKR